MRVEVAVLADYANIAEGGKLNVMGMFDHIRAPSFPCVHPSMVLALRLRVEFEDRARDHAIEVRLVDEDGQLLGGGDGKISVGPIPPGEGQIVNQILPFVHAVFPKAGGYSFLVRWDGEEKARVPLSLTQVAPPAA